MDDVLFLTLAEGVVRHVDEKYGRPAAWLAAVIMVTLPVAAILGAGWWLIAR